MRKASMSIVTDIKKVKVILCLKFGSHLSHRDTAKSMRVGSSTVAEVSSGLTTPF